MRKKYESPKSSVCTMDIDSLLTQISGGEIGTSGDVAESKRLNPMPIDDWDSEED